jgi:tripartite-type tricarboxylate transporter receptor subunit TctC
VFAPAATPAPTVARRSKALGAALRASAVARRLAEDGVEPVVSSPAELGRFWAAQSALWRPVVQASGATAD